jgi:transposase
MKEKKPRYDAALKREIAQIYLEGRRTAPSLASELGVHVNTIYKWSEQYRDDPENSFPGSGHMKPDEEELAKAKRRVRELEEEVEILKKAAAYFAKNSR